jgi:hypothetical protein
MKIQFNLSGKFKEMSQLQISGDTKANYLKITFSEYEIIKDFIKSPKQVLDLGCGLGRMSVFINSQLQDSSIHYILADSTEVKGKPSYGWNKGGFYNDLSLTRDFAIEHGLKNFEILDICKEGITTLKNIDLVVSFLAAGFHFPIEDYINDLLKISVREVTMIFGVRRGRYIKSSFSSYFRSTKLFPNFVKLGNKRTKEDILILEERI